MNEVTQQKNKGKIKVIVIITVILLALIGLGIFMSQMGVSGDSAMPMSMVSTGSITKGEIKEEVPVRGIVEGSSRSEVQPSFASEVEAIYVEEGEKVTEGQLLALLDGSDTQSQYNSASLSLSEARRKLDTSELLYAEGAISESEYLDAKAAYDRAAVEVGSYNITEKTNITSPIAGTVTRVNTTVGSSSSSNYSNEPMFIIEDLENLKLKVEISEYDISKIEEGQTVEISAEVLGDEVVYGTVSKIAPSGEQKSGSAEMIIPVEISIDNSDSKLLAGVTAKADILVAENQSALIVPIEATFIDPDDQLDYIFVVNDGILSKVQVELGVESTFDVEVVAEGIAEGDSVVLNPTFDMVDGMAVMLQEEPVQ